MPRRNIEIIERYWPYRGTGLDRLPDHWVGSVSSGTMRDEDLIPAFLDLVALVDPCQASEWSRVYTWYAYRLKQQVYGSPKFWDYCEQINLLLNEDIWQFMERIAPTGTYFGASEGDGADYGYWPVEPEEE